MYRSARPPGECRLVLVSVWPTTDIGLGGFVRASSTGAPTVVDVDRLRMAELWALVIGEADGASGAVNGTDPLRTHARSAEWIETPS